MNAAEQWRNQLLQGLPPASHTCGDEESVMIAMRDGAALATRVFKPAGEGPWPVVLIRSPYPHIAPMMAAVATLWTMYGYAVVLQDCRGTGRSGGSWVPFVHERNDGLDTLQWVIGQPWMDGSIGTYGQSYLSAVQWAMADELPDEVKAMAVSVFGTERYRQLYMNGMFRHDVYTGWAVENSGVEGAPPAEMLFPEAVRCRPHIEMDERLFGRRLPWYRDWITNVSPDDPYWSSGFWAMLKQIPRNTYKPLLMAGGWFDQHLDGMLRDYDKLPEETKQRSRLLIGPWVHSLQPSGDLTYPGSERNGFLDALEWFEHHLKGKPYTHPTGDVLTYVIGEGKWRSWDNRGIVADDRKTWFLAGADDPAGSHLEELQPEQVASVSFRYNPADPVPTKGGAGLLRYLSGAADAAPPASIIQDQPGTRPDVVTFESPPLTEKLRIAGAIAVTLYVSSNAADTSFAVNVMEVFAGGGAYNIRDGITSLSYRNNAAHEQAYEPGSIVPVTIELWPITWTIQKDSRLRLDVSSSNFPAYHTHTNEQGAWAYQANMKPALQTVYTGPAYPSILALPCMADEQ